MKELAIILKAFTKVADAFSDVEDNPRSGGQFKSGILNQIISSLPELKKPVENILRDVNLSKLEQGDKTSLWNDWDKHPEIEDAKMVCSQQLAEHRKY